MGGEYESGGAVRVSRALETLKRTGSNVLLVGSAAGAHDAACHRLCGTAAPAPRYRLFVTDGATASSADCDGGSTVRTIEYGSLSAPSASDRSVGAGRSLEALGLAVIETIDEFAAEANGLEPSQLRVCVDSLGTLFRRHDAEEVFRLLHVLRSRIDRASGMGHFHASVDRDHEAVRLLEPLFDATVVVRSRGSVHEHRWELRDRDVATDWIRL